MFGGGAEPIGGGRGLAPLQAPMVATALIHTHYFKHHFIHSTAPPPPSSKWIKQNKLATYIKL